MNTFLEINLEKLQKNIRNLKSLLKPETKFLAVIKSNAYGHGLVECARAANIAGANWFGVVYLEEAMELRCAGILKPILILKMVASADARQAANQEISIPIVSLAHAHEISETNFDKVLKVHLKVETGLNRFGLQICEISEAAKLLKTNRNIKIEGLYSHFASVEENDLAHAKIQITNFKKAIKVLESTGTKNFLKHMAATSATLLLPESHFNMVRCGIGIYGLWPSVENKEKYCSSPRGENFLQPVLKYQTYLSQIKTVEVGEKIGYGCTYEAKSKMTIGIIPVGYYEGLDRGLSNCGEVLISGTKCPIIGRVCMNLSIIDLSSLEGQSFCSFKDCPSPEVMIICKSVDQEITADDIAQKIGSINYEVVTRIPACIERKYI